MKNLAETIHKHAVELQAASTRLDKAEARLAVENSTAIQEPRIVELEEQVRTFTETLIMSENDSRRLNIQVVGSAEDTETGQPVDFFQDMAASHTKDDHKGHLHKAHSQTGPEQEIWVAAATIPHIQRQTVGHGSSVPTRTVASFSTDPGFPLTVISPR